MYDNAFNPAAFNPDAIHQDSAALVSSLLDDPCVTDIHLTEGRPVWSRKKGKMIPSGTLLHPHGIMYIAQNLLDAPSYDRANLAVPYRNRRLRLRFARALTREQLFIRILPEKPPSLRMIGHEQTFAPLLGDVTPGFVLVAGATGSGKSTLLAALLQHYIDTSPVHVITIEDPSEYIFRDNLGEVSQREIPDDVDTFALGLKYALREDPDLILIGEIRDSETAQTALTAAETGHLVFATIHAASVPGIIDRLMGMLEGVADLQTRLADAFRLGVHLSVGADDKDILRYCRLCWGTEETADCIREKEPYRMAQFVESYVVRQASTLHESP